MISLSKKEILDSLMRVSIISEHIVTNPDQKIIKFLVEDYMEMNENQYYWDYRIFLVMMSLRVLSYTEDSFLNLINNDNIDLSDIKDKMFINKDDSIRFSNKQIIKFIRNAVSHSDNNKQLFKISPNGKFVEVDLKDTKPIPFHIKICCEDLLKIGVRLLKASKSTYCTLIDIKNNKIKRIYYKNNNNLSDKCSLPSDVILGSDESLSIVTKHLENNNINYEIKEYQLMPQQIKLIKEFEEKYSEIINNYPEHRNELYMSFLNSVIPLSQEKIYSLFNNIQLFILMYRNPDYTYNQFSEEIINGYLKAFSDDNQLDEELSDLSKFNYQFQKEQGQNMEHFFQTLKSLSSINNVPLTEFITYFFSCICFEETIEINGESMAKENIRNSFVHGRWFFDIDSNIVCCDTKNGKNNDYNFYFTKTLSLTETVKYCVDYNRQIDNNH